MASVLNSFGDSDTGNPIVTSDAGLVSFVMDKVKIGRDTRDSEYLERWREYTRLWRGFWVEKDKNVASERSKLICPALSQSIEMTVSEMEEAIFNRTAWFDIDDDIADEQKEDALQLRDQLLEDIELTNGERAIAESLLLGAIYGTPIVKVNVDVIEDRVLGEDGSPIIDEKVIVPLEAVRPDEFVIDASATSIESAFFVAHEVIKPNHTIEEKQDKGVYNAGFFGTYTGESGDPTGKGTKTVKARDDASLITEYCGKVPAHFIPAEEGDIAEDVAGYVEAIVTVANESFLLRAIRNPFLMQDRPFVGCQHDTVPGEFWGRGVAEKGYNPQKALDSELRARFDALALTTAPMLGADMTRMPRNPDLRVRPGKVFQTRGRPSEILEPIGFTPQGLALTFQQSGDLERMVQMATGAMDSATPVGINRRNETASGMSMLQASFLKRAKRSMKNIERNLLIPVLRKMMWRYMQFDPQRYPRDYKFKINAAMGIMAKEVENQQLVQMLGFCPPDSPGHDIILKALFENTTSSEKPELMAAINAKMAPPSPEQQQQQQMMQQIQIGMAVKTLEELTAKVTKLMADAQLATAKATRELVNADLEDDRVSNESAYAAIAAEQTRISRTQAQNEAKRLVLDAHNAVSDNVNKAEDRKEKAKDRDSKEKQSAAKAKARPAKK